MNKNNIVWGAGAVVVSLILVGVFHIGAITQEATKLGSSFGAGITNLTGLSIAGSPGTFDTSALATLNGGLLQTSTNSTTTSVSTTLIASDINAYDTVLLNPIVGSITITFPASSTVSTFLPTAGNRQRTCFQNATTTAGVVITFAGGTGFNLQTASSSVSAVGASTLYPQKIGCFDFVRGASSATKFDIEAAYTAFN